jgi:hypothetical protein
LDLPVPLVTDTDPDRSIIEQKYYGKPLFPLFCDFLSLKNDANVPKKSNWQKNDKK